ncbi:MAG: sugar ABC transporter permease [Christensenellaceae bacterium]|nr:sugar ABC transporter permease [Christensenellaceae bacterium]
MQRKLSRLEERSFLLFILPAFSLYVVFWMFPIVITAPFSLISWNGVGSWTTAKFVGLNNYLKILSDKTFYIALTHNFQYMLVTMIAIPTIAFFLALFVEKIIKNKSFFRTSLFIPIVLPLLLVTLMFKYVYHFDYGLVNCFLHGIGLSNLATDWLGNKATAFGALMVISVWKNTPFTMVILLASMQDVSRDLEEASLLDGCSFWKSVYHVIIPQILPVLVVAVGLVIIDAFRVFDLIYMTTEGGPGFSTTEVLGTYIYKAGFTNMRMGYAAAISMVNIVIVMIVSGIYLTINRKIDQ